MIRFKVVTTLEKKLHNTLKQCIFKPLEIDTANEVDKYDISSGVKLFSNVITFMNYIMQIE